jgi:hypothetical protein
MILPAIQDWSCDAGAASETGRHHRNFFLSTGPLARRPGALETPDFDTGARRHAGSARPLTPSAMVRAFTSGSSAPPPTLKRRATRVIHQLIVPPITTPPAARRITLAPVRVRIDQSCFGGVEAVARLARHRLVDY